MNYNGKLYGKIGRKYFDTGKTSNDWDKLEEESKEKIKLDKSMECDYCGESYESNKEDNVDEN